MSQPDIIRGALTILRDSLEPKVKLLLDNATEDEIDTLEDREIIEHGVNLATLNISDPITILTILQNLPRHRQLLFDGVKDDYVMDRITTVRRMRNHWAHFGPPTNSSSFNALRWLLEKSNDPDACRKFDQLTNSQRQSRRSENLAQTDAELNRRAHQFAEDERLLQQQQAELDRDRKDLEQRESVIRQHEAEHERQSNAITLEREDLDRRRKTLKERELALERAPTPDDLLNREQAVDAQEVFVAQLRDEYKALVEDVRSQSDGLNEERAAIIRRTEELEEREAELEELRVEAGTLSERLNGTVNRLEALERRQRQVIVKGEPVPPSPARGGSGKRDDSHAAPQTAPVSRPCRRTGCEGHLEQKQGTYGGFLGCTAYPMCRYTEEVSADRSTTNQDYGSCPDCESPLVRRQSFRGPFIGCSSYPRCRHTRNLRSEDTPDHQPAVLERRS